MPAGSAVVRSRSSASAHGLAYAGLFLFTLGLYLRPNDLLPIGSFQVMKVVAILTLVAYFMEQASPGRAFSVRFPELRYLLLLAGLMVLSMPFAISVTTAYSAFVDEFLKVLLIFVLITNVVTSFPRLRRLVGLTVVCGTVSRSARSGTTPPVRAWSRAFGRPDSSAACSPIPTIWPWYLYYPAGFTIALARFAGEAKTEVPA
jgi:hypothetical protein